MTTQIPGNENNPAAVVPVLRFRQALEKVRAEVAQLTPSELSSINLEIPSAIITVRGCVPELQALRPRIVTELPAVDLVQFDNVETYALALTQAHSQFLSASQPPVPIAELTEKLKLARELFLSDVSALARRQLLDGTRLDELKGATGPKNIATDVLMLAAMLRDNWDAIAGKTGVKLSELDEVEQMADSLTNALGIKEQGPSRSSAVSDQRQRVYTLFLRAYNQARRIVIFLRWDEGDADTIAPSLYAGRRGKPSNGDNTGADVPAAPGTAPAPVNDATHPDTPAAPGAPAGAMPVISPAMSTNGPFVR